MFCVREMILVMKHGKREGEDKAIMYHVSMSLWMENFEKESVGV